MAYEEGIKKDPKYTSDWYHKAMAQGITDDYDELIENDPNYKLAWISKANALNYLGKFEEAILACEIAIKLDPNYENAWCKYLQPTASQ